jgi:trigger factor
MEDEAVKTVVAATEIDIPTVMVDHEVEDYIRELESRIAYQGMELKTYLQLMGKDINELKSQYAEKAAENVKTKLTLEAIFKAEKIEITDADITEKLTKFAESYGRGRTDPARQGTEHPLPADRE